MEQHPVPQNVTGFQFKLIGDITLKQFAYLAGGLLTAYLLTKVGFLPFFIRYPVAVFIGLLGVGLAFLPIEERPMDKWLMAFFKSIYAPTQFVWKKDNQPPEILATPTTKAIDPTIVVQKIVKANPNTNQQAQEFMQSLPKNITTTIPAPTSFPTQNKNKIMSPPEKNKTVPFKPGPPLKPVVPQPTPKPPPPPMDIATRFNIKPAVSWNIGAPTVKKAPSTKPLVPSPSITGKKVVFQQPISSVNIPTPAPQNNNKNVEKIKSDYQKITDQLNEHIKTLQVELSQGTLAKERFIELQQVLTQLMTEKEKLNNELIKLKQQIGQTKETVEKPTAYTTVPQDTRTTVKIVSPVTASKAGIPSLTQVPNVITGLIKNSKGMLLPGLIITVKDKESIPVRALKTNRLGQFAASTPLSSGTYIIEVEDPKKTYQFNKIEVTLSNQVLPPLEISAVSERDLLRQQLSQELFGNQI